MALKIKVFRWQALWDTLAKDAREPQLVTVDILDSSNLDLVYSQNKVRIEKLFVWPRSGLNVFMKNKIFDSQAAIQGTILRLLQSDNSEWSLKDTAAI